MLSLLFGPSALKPKRALEVIAYLARRLPDEQPITDFEERLVAIDTGAQDDFLRRSYLEVESRLLEQKLPGWSDAQTIRSALAQRFHIERYAPSGFSVLFLPAAAQLFFLFRAFLERIWERAGWEEARVQHVLRGTVFGKMRPSHEGEWQKAYGWFRRLSVRGRGNAEQLFRPVVEQTFRELVQERGQSRSRIVFEEAARWIQEEFGELEAITGFLDVLPAGVLEEERVGFASREDLAETVARQTQELKGKNIALVSEAKQLRETIQELERAKAAAEAMSRAQQDFIGVVSHQFRTPLAAIRWQAAGMLEFVAEHPELTQIKEAAAVVRDRSTFLIEMLENVFDLLAIESGTFALKRHPVSLPALIDEVCKEFSAEAQMKNIVLTCNAGVLPEVDVDSKAVQRVLRILVANAIQYSQEGGSVSVSVEQHEHEGAPKLLVRVQDSGIGIRPDERPRIFERFFRSKNAISRVPDGVGIALFIAKSIVELHGGKMWAESEGEGLGATFVFTTPFANGNRDED